MSRHGLAWYDMACHGTARHCTARAHLHSNGAQHSEGVGVRQLGQQPPRLPQVLLGEALEGATGVQLGATEGQRGQRGRREM